MNQWRVFVLLLCMMQWSFASAQKRSSFEKNAGPTPHRLLALKATGSTRYTDTEILGASGLQLGQDAAEGDFKEAAQRLGESGMFSGVVYSFTYSDGGSKLDLQLTDVDKSKLVPASFENFVWFTDAELLAALQQRVPLFKQLMPVTGRLPDEVTSALQALLSEKHYPGRVDFLREGKQDGGDLVGIVYRVEEVSIRIRKVEFPGASPEQAAFLTSAARTLAKAEYLRSKLVTITHFDFLPLCLERGYLRAAFGEPEAQVVPQPDSKPDDSASNEIEVDASVPVTMGKVFSVSGVTWKGNSAVKSDDASPLLHLVIGQPANAVRLARDEESLHKLYRSRGYMTAEIKTEAHLDDANATVHYDINIKEGDLYKMGELEIIGVDSGSKDRLQNAWTLREGDPYNAEYTRKFLEEAVRYVPRGLQYSTRLDEALDSHDKTVDVTIRFKPQ
jgi:outer membrane protein insertion porin family